MRMWGCSVDVFFFKQKTAYEVRISDWSSDVCSSDLGAEKIADSCALCRRNNNGAAPLVLKRGLSAGGLETLDLDADAFRFGKHVELFDAHIDRKSVV